MSKVYMVGEKNGKKYVAHTDGHPLDNAEEITKAEYRRYRAAGIPSWGEERTAMEKSAARDPKRARRWELRAALARKEAQKMEWERMLNWHARRAKAVAERAQATA